MANRARTTDSLKGKQRNNETVWAVRLSEDAKTFLRVYVDERKVPFSEFLTNLAESLRNKTIGYEEGKFVVPEKYIIRKYSDETKEIERLNVKIGEQEEEIIELKGQVKVKKELLETIKATIREELVGIGRTIEKREQEEKAGKIDLTALSRIARQRGITEQSVLDQALKLYR